MASHRDKVLAIFERHRIAPGTPYDEGHFLDFLLAHPKKQRAVYDSFRGLRRFNAFIDEIQYEFAICFSIRDREANYSVDRFVDRVKELETSRRSSLASLKNQIKAGAGWPTVIFAYIILLIAAIWLRDNTWALVVLVALAAILTTWFLRFAAQAKGYHARLLAKIEGKED